MKQLSLIGILKDVRGRLSDDEDRKAVTAAINEAMDVQETLRAVEGMREAQRKAERTRLPLAKQDAKNAADIVDRRIADDIPENENQLELF
jgi:hypothetical protein